MTYQREAAELDRIESDNAFDDLPRVRTTVVELAFRGGTPKTITQCRADGAPARNQPKY